MSADLTITPDGLEANAELGVPGKKLKMLLSGYMASSAALFTRQALALEQAPESERTERLLMDHRSYSISAVIASVTFLEAAINELYLDAVDLNLNTFLGHEQLAELMGHLWDEVDQQAILPKYQVVLTLARKPPFPKGEEPYQGVDSLIRLRNTLIHYKPEWDTDLDEHRKLEARLSGRFVHNPLVPATVAFMPHRCLGHGCADWSSRTALDFYTAFMTRVGLPIRQIAPPECLQTH